MPPKEKVLVYLIRRDLRLADNPILHEVSRIAAGLGPSPSPSSSSSPPPPFTHLLPVYVFPADQIEVSGFLASPLLDSPYKEARSQVAGFWRCGANRAKFLAESVWDLKGDLERVGSGLQVRVGTIRDAVEKMLEDYQSRRDEVEISGLWMTEEYGVEEKREERHVRRACRARGVDFRAWKDEKYLIHDGDLPFENPEELSDVFTAFRKRVEPLRTAPRECHPTPDTLPPQPTYISPQSEPFKIPDTLEAIISALQSPIGSTLGLSNAPAWPAGTKSAHPFDGGSKAAHTRLEHLISSGGMSAYKDTRNGLVGIDFSTKLSAWLALGCMTARQVHWKLVDFEDGKTELGRDIPGYGEGENKGTVAVRFELLWRDYMRLSARKVGPRLFHAQGFRDDKVTDWRYMNTPMDKSSEKPGRPGSKMDDAVTETVLRFVTGRTGTGLVDASQRELFLTGYTSNRARQNVASYLTKHLGVDWRIGAEWYECNLVDYDVSNNWGNWCYVSGTGGDPRDRTFNPIKQALDYDPQGEYVRAWVAELRDVQVDSEDKENLMGLYQAWRLPSEEKRRLGIEDVDWVRKPLIRIDFSLHRRGGGAKNGKGRARGRGGHSGRGGGGPGFERKGAMDRAMMAPGSEE